MGLRAVISAAIFLPFAGALLVLMVRGKEASFYRWLSLPFSAAVRVGNLLYLSGQLGVDSTNKLAPGGIEAEPRQALSNIKRLLEANGSDMDHVVKCLVMLADIGEWAKMNGVYVTFFPNHRPARSAFGATGLALGGRLEIECIATVR